MDRKIGDWHEAAEGGAGAGWGGSVEKVKSNGPELVGHYLPTFIVRTGLKDSFEN